MDSFITIRFKRKITKRFEEFSKTQFKTHTETMDAILGFFSYNEKSLERLGPTGRTLKSSKQRINTVMTTMRDKEKTRTKLTDAMIESNFQTEEPTKKPLILEKEVRLFDRFS